MPITDHPRAAVLFDVDGTLVDSSYLHTLAWWQSFRQAGLDVPMASIHRSVGMGGDKLLDHLLPDRDRDGDDALTASQAAVFATYWPALRRTAGARELLVQCHDVGLAVALASSAHGRDLEMLRAAIDADAYPISGHQLGQTRRRKSKPQPDIWSPRWRPGVPRPTRSTSATPSGTSRPPPNSAFPRSP